MPSAIQPRPFTPEPERAGNWDSFIVPNNGRVVGIVDAGTGPVAVIAANDWKDPVNRNMVRLYEPEGDGWQPITDWVGPNVVAAVKWKTASVLDGSIVVTARESGVDGLPVSVVFHPGSDSHTLGSSNGETGDGQVRVKRTTAGGDPLVAITRDRRIAVWESWGGVDWDEATPPDGWPEGTASLLDLTNGDGIWAIGARRRQGDSRTDFVMTSRDGREWQATSFAGYGAGEIRELAALGTDGSTILAIGSDGEDSVVTQTSTDGTTWSAPQPAAVTAFGDSAPRFHTIVSDPEGTFLAGRASYNTDYRHCYVAGRSCGVELEMVWMAKDGSWRPIVAPSDLETQAVALIDGALYVGGEHKSRHSNRSHWWIATWIPNEPETIPFVMMPADEPPQFDAPVVHPGSTLRGGVTYAWIGCEGCARFNGFEWHIESTADDAAEILAEPGAVGSTLYCGDRPSGYLNTARAIYGTVELLSPNRIEWSIPGHGPIAYLRAGDAVSGEIGCSL